MFTAHGNTVTELCDLVGLTISIRVEARAVATLNSTGFTEKCKV